MPLDKSRPYGTIYGEHHCQFTQNGKDYNNEGLEVDKTGKVIEDRSALRAMPPEKTGPRRPTANPPPIDPEDEIAGEDEELDLDAWAADEIKAPWAAVVAAIQRKYDVTVKSKIEAKELLAEKKAA